MFPIPDGLSLFFPFGFIFFNFFLLIELVFLDKMTLISYACCYKSIPTYKSIKLKLKKWTSLDYCKHIKAKIYRVDFLKTVT